MDDQRFNELCECIRHAAEYLRSQQLTEKQADTLVAELGRLDEKLTGRRMSLDELTKTLIKPEE